MSISGALVTAALLATAGGCWAGEVVVELQGVQARGGTLYAALQRNGEFMQARSSYGAQAVSPGAGVLRLTIQNVEPGDYALSVLHDADGDGQMKRAADGRPEEGWAMSRGEALRALPTFDQVKITVPETGATIRAAMSYPAAPATR